MGKTKCLAWGAAVAEDLDCSFSHLGEGAKIGKIESRTIIPATLILKIGQRRSLGVSTL
jgi:hypothetical protein